MKILLSFFKYIIYEVAIVFALILLLNNYVGNAEETINADGIGYYEYLPSILIHHDLYRKGDPVNKTSIKNNRIDSTGVYVEYDGYKVNKYPCGTALLQLPFFVYTYLSSERSGDMLDGYQRPFQRTVFHAAIFYLFFVLLFLKKILTLYDVKTHVIVFCQFILVMGTSVTHYVNYDAAFSHVYSLFAITVFIYYMKLYMRDKSMLQLAVASFFLGLIFILRQPNILVVLFVPFLAGSRNNFIDLLKSLFGNLRSLALSVFLFFGVLSIQSLLWYLQTGHLFIYSYQGETFDFLNPHFIDVLFSYRKGFFIYTPIMLIAALSMGWYAYKKHHFLLLTWFGFFVLLTYFLSSWWSWYYGCSFGLRAYVDYYVLFLIPFAVMLNGVSKLFRFLIIGLSLFTVPLNLIQTYQYNRYILHWIDMDKEKYWKVFLKTNKKYKGILWIKQVDENLYSTSSEIFVGDVYSPKDSSSNIFTVRSGAIPNFEKVSVIQVFVDNDFEESNETKIIVDIDSADTNSVDSLQNYYSHEVNFIHYHQKNFGEWQTGSYDYIFSPMIDDDKIISIRIKGCKQNVYLKNARVKFLFENPPD